MKDYTVLAPEEKEALVQKAMAVGFQTETDYGNCIQSALNGMYTAFPDIGLTEDMLQACFGIAGGCGLSLMGTCGALNAAAWIISMFYGRPINDLDGKYDDCQVIIRTVVERFRERYGGILCHEVLTHNMGAPYDWKTPEGDAEYTAHNGVFHCSTAVAFCNEIVARMIVNGELKYTNKKEK